MIAKALDRQHLARLTKITFPATVNISAAVSVYQHKKAKQRIHKAARYAVRWAIAFWAGLPAEASDCH
jgi:hypothetical protein